jgi:pentatricopeptide repeat protein
MTTNIKQSQQYASQIQEILLLAIQQYKNENFQEVEKLLSCILVQNSSCIEVFKLLAMLAHRMNDFDKAILNYKQVIGLNHNEVDTYNKLGMIYQQLEKFEEAITYFQKSLILKPNSLDIYKRLAYSLGRQGRLEEAIDLFNQILAIEPDDIKTRWNRSLTLLKSGNFQEGLPDYEYRKHLPNFPYFLDCTQPLWNASDLDGKTILLHHEDDGFGDIIHYIRYAPLVSKKGVRVIFACTKPLLKLLQNVSGIEQLVETKSELPNFDVYVPLLSLPYYLGTTLETIPATIPYITVPKFEQPLLPQKFSGTNFKIGIVWSSGHRERIGSTTSIYRDCPLSLFLSLLSITEVSLYSLQVGKWASEVNEFKHESRLYDLTPQIKDFADTAALISQLDLIISVDTAVVHLAGAMGLPVWNLLSFDADWRWLQDRNDSPWYPTMRLFRQRQYGDWTSIFEQVIPALKQHLASYRG